MSNELIDLFLLDRGRTHFNHASFGTPSRALLDQAQESRHRFEADTAGMPDHLVPGLRAAASRIEASLGLTGGQAAITMNSTEANSALAASWPLGPSRRVALLSLEYSSVVVAWQLACARAGASALVIDLPLPTTRQAVLTRLERLPSDIGVLVLSAISSTAALSLPLAETSALCAERGIDLIVDAAHVVGHGPTDFSLPPCAALFASAHKWLPGPRSVGFLWVADQLADRVKPALVALRRDTATLAERFSWRGTWDPTPALMVEPALAAVAGWRADGLLDQAVATADASAAALVGLGLVPTGDSTLRTPRLRAFVVPDTTPAVLEQALAEAGVVAWVGTDPTGPTILRLSTHIYNDAADVRRLTDAVAGAVRRI
ncbi:MAG: aminotransferase class V-fold PLP-dependent enzyme [Propionibacteriaceae bacterium]|jgi:isopenicillin-N epimerase|nr:aminotransferase class V-fold PLP-dependent enzyme [Propionibacteriaceae bacterium]